MPTPNVIQVAQAQRAASEKQDAQALAKLADAYGGIYKRLQADIELLAKQISEEKLTPGQVVKLQRYKDLIKQTEAELKRFGNYTEVTLTDAAKAAIARSGQDAWMLMHAAALDAGIAATFNRLPKGAIEQLVGFLDPSSPLYKRIEMLAPYNTEYVKQTILTLAGTGRGPREIARQIQYAYGNGLTDALRLTRTVQLYAYREANRANYAANADIIDGWVWYAQLDASTCASCIAQHGTIHPLNEVLNDHHNGRCANIPHIKDGVNPVVAMGEDWFNRQSDKEQQAILGKGKYDAWKAGKFEFSQLSAVREDAVYGPMRTAATLQELTS